MMFLVAAFAAPPPSIPAEPELHVRCASLANLEDAGAAGAFVQQLTSHIPTEGPAEIWGSRNSEGSTIRFEATLTDPSVLPDWLASYDFAEVEPGFWISSFGSTASLAGDRLVVERHDSGTFPDSDVPVPELPSPRLGCSATYRTEARPPLIPSPSGVGVEFPATGRAILHLIVPGGPKLWKGMPPAGPPVARGRFSPELLVRVNLADTSGLFRAFPQNDVPPGTRLDLRWLDAVGDRLASGAEVIFARGEFLAVLPLNGVSGGKILATYGKVSADGVVALKQDGRSAVYMSTVGKSLVAASSRALAADAHAGVGEPLFPDDPIWTTPGLQLLGPDATRQTTQLALVAAGEELVTTAVSQKLADLENVYLPRPEGFISQPDGPAPEWPNDVPRTGDPVRCQARFLVDSSGRVAHLAVWGCPPAFVRSVRSASSSWKYPVPMVVTAVSLRERLVTVLMRPGADTVYTEPPRRPR